MYLWRNGTTIGTEYIENKILLVNMVVFVLTLITRSDENYHVWYTVRGISVQYNFVWVYFCLSYFPSSYFLTKN